MAGQVVAAVNEVAGHVLAELQFHAHGGGLGVAIGTERSGRGHCVHASAVACATLACCRMKSRRVRTRPLAEWESLEIGDTCHSPSSKSTLCSWHLVQNFMVGGVARARVLRKASRGKRCNRR